MTSTCLHLGCKGKPIFFRVTREIKDYSKNGDSGVTCPLYWERNAASLTQMDFTAPIRGWNWSDDIIEKIFPTVLTDVTVLSNTYTARKKKGGFPTEVGA